MRIRYPLCVLVLASVMMIAAGSMKGQMVPQQGGISAVEEDPASEDPTDIEVTIDIDEPLFDLNTGSEFIEMEWSVTGTTSGPVHHCSIIVIVYYRNGTYKDYLGDWMDGPDDTPRTSIMGSEYEYHFWGTGNNGHDDWSTWEFYLWSKTSRDLLEAFDREGGEEDTEEIESVILYVRAYSDPLEEGWNQDARDMTQLFIDVMEEAGKDDEKEDGLLSFPVSVMEAAACSLLVLGVTAAMRFRGPAGR